MRDGVVPTWQKLNSYHIVVIDTFTLPLSLASTLICILQVGPASGVRVLEQLLA
jgi:hypothetical protein